MNAKDYVGRLRDTKLEKEIVGNLHQAGESTAFDFVCELLDVHEVVALDVARRCLRSRDHFVAILRMGLVRGDAGSIKHWLECVKDRLGLRRVILCLVESFQEFPNGVARAMYFVRQFVDPNDSELFDALVDLERLIWESGFEIGPRKLLVDGKPYFLPVENGARSRKDVDGGSID